MDSQSPFFYYNPESASDQRQHGHFSPHPKTIQDRTQLQYQQQWIHQHSMLYGQPPMMYPQVHQSTNAAPQKGVMATPRPMQQRAPVLYHQDGQTLALDTDCNTPDFHVYPSTPALSVSGSTVSSPPSTCGILPTPITSSYMFMDNMEGVKEGCLGDVKTEILAGEDFTRCDSPPLTPVFIHPPSVTASQASDLVSLNSCPSLSPSPSPVSQVPTNVNESKLSFCDPRNLFVDSQHSIIQLPTPEFPPLPTLCSGDDEEHKLILGGDINLIKQDLHLSKALDACNASTLTGLPTFDSFSDLDSENEFVTDLTRFTPPHSTHFLGDKRQRLDLVSFDEEEFLSEDSFEDLEDTDSFLSSDLLTPPESRRASTDESSTMKLTKKRSSPKKHKKEESVEETEFDVHMYSNTNESSSESVSVAQDSSAQTSTAPSSDGTIATTASSAASSSAQATARRGRKQSLTDDPSKTFVCDICSRRFRRQEHLKRHHRSLHTHDKPFECTDCGKKFSRSDNLSQHARTHGSGAIVMGVLEEGELPPTGAGSPLDSADTGALGTVLFEAAKAAAGTSSGSSAGTFSDRGSVSPAPSIDSTKPAKKRKREE